MRDRWVRWYLRGPRKERLRRFLLRLVGIKSPSVELLRLEAGDAGGAFHNVSQDIWKWRMAKQAESRIVEQTFNHLMGQYGTRWFGFKVHGDQFTVNQPDIVGCLDGHALVIECKQPGEHARKGQLAIQRKWATAKAIVISEATSWTDVVTVLEAKGIWTDRQEREMRAAKGI